MLGFCLLLLASGPAGAAAPGELEISRNIFHQVAERPRQNLAAEGSVEVRNERWVATGVSRLRIASPEPRVQVVTRFRPGPARGSGLVLTVILVSDPRTRDFYYLGQSHLMREGKLAETTDYRVADGVETGLTGAAGNVASIVIQDDAGAELRLSQTGDLLTLEVVPPTFGGQPTGGAQPYYHGQPLRLLDGRWRGAGYIDNAYAEVRILEDFALALNAFFPNDTMVLGRAVIRRQATRWEHLAIWLEGGAAMYQEVKQAGVTDPATITWLFATSVVYRRGAWSAGAQVGTANGPALVMVSGGWQVWPRVGLLLLWQSFNGYSGAAAGIGTDF